MKFLWSTSLNVHMFSCYDLIAVSLRLMWPYAMVQLSVCWTNLHQSQFCYDLVQVLVHLYYTVLVRVRSQLWGLQYTISVHSAAMSTGIA